ncbi:MAG: GNAT family N-acetyltransferase [Acidobacteria bacterium]|nr:GNAT family N-acetyltransferase [Acidobacteriota bacterium]
MMTVAAPPLTLETVADVGAFLLLEDAWNDAVDRAAMAHPFLRHEWVRTWWECFGAGAALHILVVRREGQITAIAPLMRDTASMYGLRVRRIRLLHNDHTPRTDFIVASDAEESYRAIWSALRQDADRWDVLQLSQLEHGSPTLRVMTGLATADGWATGVWKGGESPYLPLTGTWDSYLASLPAKFRSNLRNRMTRLTRIGEPVFEVLTDCAAIHAACGDVWRLEPSGWKRDAGTAIACDDAVQRFYGSLVERGSAAGWLQLLFLRVGDRRIATSYGACFRDRLFLFKTGYDPEYAACSPFKVLTYFAVRDGYARQLAEVDFLGDSEPWKREWTDAARGHDWLYVFADTVRARLLHSLKFQVGPELKRWRS